LASDEKITKITSLFLKIKLTSLFAVVADGMGGHLGGDVASEMVVSQIGHDFSRKQIFRQFLISRDWLLN
jgi:protein phosphatase